MADFGRPLATPEPEMEFEAVEIEFPSEEEEEVEVVVQEHFDNLAATMDERDLRVIGLKVVEDFDSDVMSREDWAKSYVKGMDLLGLKVEDRTQPWQGAAGVFHPILTETIIRFQAQAMGEIMPAAGPVRTKVLDVQTTELAEQAGRVERELNYQITENMVEYREETEQQMFHLALAGSAFKKVFFDPIESRPCAMFVPAEDLVVAYGAINLERAERCTHVMRRSYDEIRDLMDAGFYKDVELPDAEPFQSDIQKKYDDLSGEEAPLDRDSRHTILETHGLFRIEDEERARPYVVTVDKSSGKVLSIYRNWREDDPTYRKKNFFVHYKYLPGMGFYGIGLIHLLGGLSKTATSILRQLIDAGTLANLPAGLKSRGLRIKGDNTPFRPGEFRDVDVMGSSIKESITFLPYKEPSAVLYQLLNSVVEEARRIGSVAESELLQLNKEMPVGTAFAVLERQMKVMTGVQARIHAALKKELKMIAEIIYVRMSNRYDWDLAGKFDRTKDFDGRVDVVPVSDPNAATNAQKVVAYQAAMEMAARAPNLYNMGKLHRGMLETLRIDGASEILKLPEDIKPADPVTENMAILKQEPVKAFLYQDHEAHLRVHIAAANDPKIQQIVGQSPFAPAIQSAIQAHITEHIAFEYRKQIEQNLGVALPPEGENLPEDVEVELSRLSARAAEKLLGKNKAEVAAEEARRQAQDPLTQIQMRELKIKEDEVKNKHDIDLLKVELSAVTQGVNLAHMRERLSSEEMRAALNAAVKLSTELNREDKVAVESEKLAVQATRDKLNANKGK